MNEELMKEVAELKKLAQENARVNAETNDMVRKLRRSARWSLIFTILYWLLVLGVLGAFSYYASAYLHKIFGALPPSAQ